ncbi:thiol reductant ABC exporter subunit CydC [Neokomagataea thailandica]|uniref:Transport ATP-binding protein CydD n=1 Tax=Neokomagataea tanensis NBRC 106556 TaxID=1223519 RepID=A0ABQ0QK88_9PROT|nr:MULTISPECIES: thiol reductant ABC exporter subunit CydC [Neokomagataea]GBR47748.1 transport ATP-binding protein CydD [Neokomagataea tanensis NBRC 106556]
MSSHSSAPLSRIIRLWRPHYAHLIVGLILSELAVCAGLIMMGKAGQRMTAAALGVSAGTILLQIAGTSQIILRYADRYSTHNAMFKALADLRVWFFRRLAHGAAAGLGFQRSGDLLSRLVSDIQTLDNFYLRIIVPLASAALTLPLTAYIWCRADMMAGIIMTILFAVMAFVLPLLASKQAQTLGPAILNAESHLRVTTLDLTTGLREARAFGAEKNLTTRVIQSQETLIKYQHALHLRMALMHGCARLLGQVGVGITLCLLAGIFFHTSHTPILAVTALFVALTAFENISGLSKAGLLTGKVVHASERIMAVADQPHATTRTTKPLPAGRDLTLNAVSFRWTEQGPLIFNHAHATLRHGERVALIAPSGSGKSSLAALLLKVANPTSGHISLGGTDIADLSDDALRSQIAWLSQASHLFDDTIRGNLLLGRTDINDDTLWDALERAQIATTLRELPEGLETWVGENGSKLSGGQGRRIALARVLLSNAPILILDEPASGLDADTERAFLQTLNSLDDQRSIILIAHRLIGVERLDRIWTLKNGQILSQAS